MQHTLKTESGECLVVDVPETLYKSYIYYVGASKYLCAYYQSNENWKYKDFYLPPGNWEIIGLYPGITEEQAKGIVDKVSNEFYVGYKDYRKEISAFHSASESFASLLEANRIYTVNPHGNKPEKQNLEKFTDGWTIGYINKVLKDKLEEWQEAEERTSKFKLILKKL